MYILSSPLFKQNQLKITRSMFPGDFIYDQIKDFHSHPISFKLRMKLYRHSKVKAVRM